MNAIPGSFPCERTLAVGDLSVFSADVFYCLDCYEFARAVRPALGDTSRRITLRRGLTCGGGAAQD
jgi:hypothetical protein